MSKNLNAENAVLSALLKNAALQRNSWLALFSSSPTDADTGGLEVTTVATGYARVNITSLLGAAAAGSITNTSIVNFAAALINYPNPVTHVAIYDAVTAGNRSYWGAVTTTRTILAGDTPTFPVSALTITED